MKKILSLVLLVAICSTIALFAISCDKEPAETTVADTTTAAPATTTKKPTSTTKPQGITTTTSGTVVTTTVEGQDVPGPNETPRLPIDPV